VTWKLFINGLWSDVFGKLRHTQYACTFRTGRVHSLMLEAEVVWMRKVNVRFYGGCLSLPGLQKLAKCLSHKQSNWSTCLFVFLLLICFSVFGTVCSPLPVNTCPLVRLCKIRVTHCLPSHTHTHTRTRARTHARTHAHTHSDQPLQYT
jgi:hypothetical protein